MKIFPALILALLGSFTHGLLQGSEAAPQHRRKIALKRTFKRAYLKNTLRRTLKRVPLKTHKKMMLSRKELAPRIQRSLPSLKLAAQDWHRNKARNLNLAPSVKLIPAPTGTKTLLSTHRKLKHQSTLPLKTSNITTSLRKHHHLGKHHSSNPLPTGSLTHHSSTPLPTGSLTHHPTSPLPTPSDPTTPPKRALKDPTSPTSIYDKLVADNTIKFLEVNVAGGTCWDEYRYADPTLLRGVHEAHHDGTSLILGQPKYTALYYSSVQLGYNPVPSPGMYPDLPTGPGYPNAILYHPYNGMRTGYVRASIIGHPAPVDVFVYTALPKLMIFAPELPCGAAASRLSPAAYQVLEDQMNLYGLSPEDIKYQLVVQNMPYNLSTGPEPIYADRTEAKENAQYRPHGLPLLRTHYNACTSKDFITRHESFDEKYTFDAIVLSDTSSPTLKLQDPSGAAMLKDQKHQTHNISTGTSYTPHLVSPNNTPLEGLTLDPNGLMQDSVSFTTIVVYKEHELTKGSTHSVERYAKPKIVVARSYILNERDTHKLNENLHEAGELARRSTIEASLRDLHQKVRTNITSVPLAEDLVCLMPR